MTQGAKHSAALSEHHFCRTADKIWIRDLPLRCCWARGSNRSFGRYTIDANFLDRLYLVFRSQRITYTPSLSDSHTRVCIHACILQVLASWQTPQERRRMGLNGKFSKLRTWMISDNQLSLAHTTGPTSNRSDQYPSSTCPANSAGRSNPGPLSPTSKFLPHCTFQFCGTNPSATRLNASNVQRLSSSP